VVPGYVTTGSDSVLASCTSLDLEAIEELLHFYAKLSKLDTTVVVDAEIFPESRPLTRANLDGLHRWLTDVHVIQREVKRKAS
jgi:hypothetical protein